MRGRGAGDRGLEIFYGHLGFCRLGCAAFNPMKKELINLLLEGERLSTAQMAEILNSTPDQILAALQEMESEELLLGWRPILNFEAMETEPVRAIIEVRIRPEREGGFDRLALRISQFDEVESCYLVSGAYDLLLISNGTNLHQIARFVSEKLSTMDGVLSTSTHFMLKPFKEQGYAIARAERPADRPAISP